MKEGETMDTKQSINPEQIRSKLVTMRDQISVLEWDEKMGQINPYKKVQLVNLRKEFKDLEGKLEAAPVL